MTKMPLGCLTTGTVIRVRVDLMAKRSHFKLKIELKYSHLHGISLIDKQQ